MDEFDFKREFEERQSPYGIETRKNREREDADFAAVFGSQQGERVLELIRRYTIERTTVPQCNVADGMAMALLSYLREGENNLYRWILTRVERGRQG